MTLFIITICNFVVGALIGLTGIAGFLLPMLYVSLGYVPHQAMALSFSAFLVSGLLGSINYYKNGQLPIRVGTRLGLFSLIGATIGVYLNSFFSDGLIQILLYMVVLISGLSILFRKDKEKDHPLYPGWTMCSILGIFTAAICALSGAGGPVLVMPLLVLIGVSIRESVALALFDSIFIAIPSMIGYFLQCDMATLWTLLFISAAAHGVGVFLGSKNANKVDQKIIKKIVAIGSIIIAIYKLFY